VAVWARNQVTNTDRHVRTVAPLAADPAIQAAIADQQPQLPEPSRAPSACRQISRGRNCLGILEMNTAATKLRLIVAPMPT
jgi:hypothetical protein